MSSSNKLQLNIIDGLRGFAAIIVSSIHIKSFLGIIPPKSGELAVDFFLILSGFFMSYGTQTKIKEKSFKLFDFVRHRFTRLYPGYFIGLLIGVPSALAKILIKFDGGGGTVWNFNIFLKSLPNLIILPSFNNGFMFPLNPVLATVFYIFLITCIYGLIYAKFNKVPIKILSGLAVILLFILIYISQIEGNILIGGKVHELPIGFIRSLYGFTIGLITFQFYRFKNDYSNFSSFCIPVLFFLSIFINTENKYLILFKITFLFPFIIFQAASFNPHNKLLIKIFSFLGTISFPLYIIHNPLSQMLEGISLTIFPNIESDMTIYLGFSILIICIYIAWLIGRNIEPKLILFLRKGTNR